MPKPVFTSDPATCATLDGWQLRHVALHLDVSTRERRLSGTAQLRFVRGPTASAELRLDVFRLRVHSVSVHAITTTLDDANGEDDAHGTVATVWRTLPFTVFGDALEVVLPPSVAHATALELVVHYETTPESPGVCWLTAQQTAGKRQPYMYTQGQEVLNRSVFPCHDSPSVRVTYTASITVPSELVCVMSAKLRGVETVQVDGVAKTRFDFEMNQSIPVYLVAMAVGDLVSADVGPRSKIWTEPCMLETSTREFEGVIEKYLCTGEELFGEYRWEQYDVLVMPPSFPYGGMENPRLTFVSPSLLAGDQSLSSVIAHEIAHSWFGNLVTNASWSDFFLNEGFTMYAERRITEAVHGRALMCLNAKLGEALLREEISSLGEDSPLTRLRVPLEQGIDPGDCYNQCAYEKGYAFVSYLRSLVGSDKVFDDFLKAYCDNFRFQSIAAEDTIRFFLEYFPHLADGTELKGPIKFATWLHEPGYPRYSPDLSDAKEIMESCEALAYHWEASASNEPVLTSVLYLTEEAKSWPVFQLLYFLDCCFDASFASNASTLIELGDALSLWETTNTEVMFRWSQVLIKNVVEAKLGFVRAFLELQGKQKFQIPIFRLLAMSASAALRAFAIETYALIRPLLHVMVRDRIELLLGAA